MKTPFTILIFLIFVLISIYLFDKSYNIKIYLPKVKIEDTVKKPSEAKAPDSLKNLLIGAKAQINTTKSYDPAYTTLSYPNGDVPIGKGVCSDVVVRAFRAAGVDLQQAVHVDMVNNFKVYPNRWGLTKPDANIDHRRVPNLQTFFTRKGKALKVSYRRDDYRPGDIVTWDLNNYGLAHIGLVSDI